MYADQGCPNMARYVWITKGFSPRDGGWVRFEGMDGAWRNEEDAWRFIQLIWPLMVLSADYVTVNVVRTIQFTRSGRLHEVL